MTTGRLECRVAAIARERGLVPAVLTFDPHPAALLQPSVAPPMLTSLSRRCDLLAAAGAPMQALQVVPGGPNWLHPGRSGTITKDGITAKYAYADGEMTVEIVDKPAFVPVSLIEGMLKARFEASIAAGGDAAV